MSSGDCSRGPHCTVEPRDSRYHDQRVLHRVVPYTALCRVMRGFQVEFDSLYRLYYE